MSILYVKYTYIYRHKKKLFSDDKFVNVEQA